MAEKTYDAADIQVLEFDDAVRASPGMYFGAAQGDPALATKVLCRVVGHSLHPAVSVARPHSLRVIVEISADLTFSVADDHVDPLDGHGKPRLGYYGSLLGNDRWLSAAAAAVSSHAVVEVWREGRGFRQELHRLRPAGAPEEFEAAPGSGTRVSFELDPAYFGSDSAITSDLTSLELHGPHCTGRDGAGYVVFRDHRDGGDRPECRLR
ncbi:hypothetical protein [Streptomyces sp. NPDC048332]|uniref:hypothetical protein n=1 Tax=Streptomyces sp. NPDC048332 TaxID=3154619 RepID=UPI0034197C49